MTFRVLLLACAMLCPTGVFAQAPADAERLEQQATELFSTGKTAEAIAALERVRGMRRAAGDKGLEARALYRLAVGYRGAGRNEDAVRAARESFELARSVNEDATAAEALGQLYQARSYHREFPDAQKLLDEALRLARRANQPRTLARVLDSRARWLGEVGRQEDAIAAATEGLTYADSAGDHALSAGLLAIRGTFYSRSGLLADALADALRARDAAAQAGPRAEVTALFSLAQAHSHLSNSAEAVRLWTEVIDRYRAIGPPIGMAIALDARCHVQYDAGRFAESLADARDAIAAHMAIKQRPSSASYSRAGMASIRLGRDTEGRQWLSEAEARTAGAPDYEQAQTWTHLGISYNLLGDADNARRAFEKVLDIAHRTRSLEDEQRALIGLGRAALIARDPAGAIERLERAVSIIETLRATVPANQLRAAYLSRRVEAHEWLTTALMMESSSPTDAFVERAFNTAERARVRALADLLAEGRAKRASSTAARTREQIAANLGPRDLLLEYLVGEQDAYGWALTRDTLVGFKLPRPNDLQESVRRMLSRIDSDDRTQLQVMAEDFTPALLGPALSRLSEFDRIIFVPDGPLQRVPFAALPMPGGSYLAEHAAISTVGSGSLLELLKRGASAAGVLALASSGNATGGEADSRSTNAPLRQAEGEIGDAIRLLAPADGGRAIADATELAVKNNGFADYRIIHIAAHSLVDESLPRNSAILLRSEGREDGALRAAEIAQIPVRADLVVLAACRTHLGSILRGEGLISLSRSFMEAGARSVLASLWDVGDSDTRALMRRFYTGIANGLPPDEALRAAQLQLIRAGGNLASPKVWASFQVLGEGRNAVWEPRPPGVGATVGGIAVSVVAIVAILHMLRRRN